MTQTSFRWRTYAAAAATALFAAACAQSNGDINRVQPNVTKKTDLLDGVWYFRNTVTWTPATTGFTYPGQTGSMEKLVFEIQEKNLVGYRAYPYILGAEINVDKASKVTGTTTKVCDKAGKCVGGQPYYGAPVVAFPIESHFDIQRNYNAATGEQGNVISENGGDRPWNQREYIRVDWSANILNVMSGLNWGTIQNPLGGSSSGTWIQPNEKGEDPTDWPAREFDANGKLKYMDYTGRYLANPDLYYFEDYGYYPTCYLWGGEQYDCASSEIRMRISMAKVDVNRQADYEPLQYDNDLMTKFGYFRTERLNYDRKFGYNNSAVVRLANRHRFWDSYYQKDAQGVPDSTKPIPMKDRVLRPIKYYFTRADLMGGQQNYDEYMVPGRKLEKGWDKAFRRAAAAAQGKTPDFNNKDQQALYLCDNPVKEDGPCGTKGFSPKFGDLRYSFMNTVAEPVANGLLGYGPSSADPETGEIISANANTYLWGIDLYGRQVLDTIDLLLGETSVNEYITGADMKEYIKNNPTYSSTTVSKNGQSLQSELQGIPSRNEYTKGAFERPAERMQTLMQGLSATGGLPKYSRDSAREASETLAKFPQLESAILDNPDLGDDVVAMLPKELQGRAINDKDFRRKASRSVLTNVKQSHDYKMRRVEWASRNNIYLAEFFDRTLLGLANTESNKRSARVSELTNKPHDKCANKSACTAVEAKRIANDEVSMRIRQAVWEATSEHEIGHTFGLRHNFQGSFDAINYHDKYWQLRKSTLTMTQNNEQKIPRTPNDMAAAAAQNPYEDPNALGQLLGHMYDFEYSSIMDYSGKINGDWSGVGKYDEAAIIFAYSGDTAPGYVEVFDGARRESRDFAGTDGALMKISGAGLDLPIVNAQRSTPAVPNYTERFHYSVSPLHFGDGAQGTPITQVIDDGIAKFGKRSLRKYSEVKAANDALAAKLDADPSLTDLNNEAAVASAVGANPILEVPYMFCTDDHVGGILSCNRFDRGPDYFEMARTELEDYRNYYFSSHFKRDRYHFNTNYAINSAYGAFWNVADIYKKWVYEFYKKANAGQEITRSGYTIDPLIQDYWTMAVLDGINQHLNVMSVPPTGMFMYRSLARGPQWDIVSEGDEYDDLNPTGRAKIQDYYRSRYNASGFADLPRGLGRRMYSRYDYKSGFGFFNRMQEAGHYGDQMGAMFAAVFPDAEFLGVDQSADFRRYNIPYYMVFKRELTDTFSALWGSQEELVRPIMYLRKNEIGQVRADPQNGKCNPGCTIAEQDNKCVCPALDWKRFVSGKDLISNFDYPRETGRICSGGMTTNCLTADQKPAQANIQLTWTSRIYSLFLGEALFRVNYDLDYAKANQVFKLGGSEQQTIAPGFHAVEVQDILTGSRYSAIEKNGAAPNSTPAIRMIGIAKEELQMVQDPTICPLPAYLAYVGYACMGADEANNPALVEERRKYWTDVFRDTIRDLDLMRGMYQAYGKAF